MIVPVNSSSAASSTSAEGMSRLLVGSSSSRQLAPLSIRRASCTRLFSPPLRRAIGCVAAA